MLRNTLILIILSAVFLAGCMSAKPQDTPQPEPTATNPPPPADTPTPPEEKPAGFTDITFELDGTQVEWVAGLAEVEGAPGSSSKIVTRFFGNEAFGDLNGDGLEDAAFLLTQEGGGSGTFFYLLAALKTETGYVGANAFLLGDRIEPGSVSIAGGQITVQYADRQPGESFTDQPTLDVTRSFHMVSGRLEEKLALSPLSGRDWVWVQTLMNDGSINTPRKEGAFTLTFGEDGRFSGTTDCNNFFGQYQVNGNLLSFGPIGATKMYCEGSQEGEYWKTLAEIESFLFDGDSLVLLVRYDSGSMTFR